MLAGIISYGVLAYVVVYDYAYLMSLVCALSTFTTLMWFDQPTPDEHANPTPA
jgi:hypothetical protein